MFTDAYVALVGHGGADGQIETGSTWAAVQADCVSKIGLVPGEAPVSILDSRILTAFETRLNSSAQVDGATVQMLSEMLGREKPPKPEDLLKAYAASGTGATA